MSIDEKIRSNPHRRMIVVALFAAAVVVMLALATLTAVGAGWIAIRANTFHGIPFDPPPVAPQFTLTDQNRNSVRMSDLIGKPTLVYFGWTNCKTACPLTMAKWTQVAKVLQNDADNVNFVFISVDPKRDTPERMKQYLATYHPKFVGLVGSLWEIDDVLQEYLAFYQEDAVQGAEDDASFLRTTTTYVIDKRGRLVLAFRAHDPSDAIASDLRYLLRQ